VWETKPPHPPPGRPPGLQESRGTRGRRALAGALASRRSTRQCASTRGSAVGRRASPMQ
jgi:hypothetical protein